jgi:hypothetical protein
MAAHDVDYLARVAGCVITITHADTDHALDRLHYQGLARRVELPFVDGRPRAKMVLTAAGKAALAAQEST